MRRLEIDRPSGTAHLERVRTGWTVDLDPQTDVDAAVDLLEAALAAVAEQNGQLVRHWVRAGDPVASAASEALGFVFERELLQLRRPLPIDEPVELEVRPFVVGHDEAAWLAANNRAFDWHPEQGGMTLDDLLAREAEPWFDPAGFLLHEVDGQLAGFCWTKLHTRTEPLLGEIYAIAVDPASGRRGLGRPLTLAGLHHLHGVGAEVGMLYVDASNTAGRRLYDAVGFTTDHVDRAYVRQVATAA